MPPANPRPLTPAPAPAVEQAIYLLHALTPIHVGTESGLGAIDVPTTREAHTDFPIVPGSSVKGVLRERAEIELEKEYDGKVRRLHRDVAAAFGPRKDKASEHRGGLIFGDAQMVALPVRCQRGTFAWVTCPMVLDRLVRDLEGTGLTLRTRVPRLAEAPPPGAGPGFDPTQQARVCGSDALSLSLGGGARRVLLEDLVLNASHSPELELIAADLSEWVWPADTDARAFFTRRLLLVHDDLFTWLARNALEVRWRVTIDDDTGTAAGSGPWTEEHIPAEALLVGVVRGRSHNGQGDRQQAAQNLGFLRDLTDRAGTLRFGGKSSVGLGRARLRLPRPGGAR